MITEAIYAEDPVRQKLIAAFKAWQVSAKDGDASLLENTAALDEALDVCVINNRPLLLVIDKGAVCDSPSGHALSSKSAVKYGIGGDGQYCFIIYDPLYIHNFFLELSIAGTTLIMGIDERPDDGIRRPIAVFKPIEILSLVPA